jgi:hypothetical protein
MGYFTVALFPITAGFYVMFTRASQTIGFMKLAMVGVASMAVAAIVMYLFPVYDGHWMVEGSETSLLATISGFLNYSINAVGVVFWWSLLALVRNSKAGMGLAIVAMFLSESAQMNVLGAVVLLVWTSKQPLQLARILGAVVILGFPFMAVLLVAFGGQFGIDPNTVHRAQWWVEALSAVANKGGIALGFGADSTSDFAVDDRFQMLGKWGNLPIHVIHNDFIYSFYSTGVVGGILLILFHFRSLIPVKM